MCVPMPAVFKVNEERWKYWLLSESKLCKRSTLKCVGSVYMVHIGAYLTVLVEFHNRGGMGCFRGVFGVPRMCVCL